jgi:AAA-like domain
MNAEQALDVVEKVLLKRQLTALEQLILTQSWHGLGYEAMAQNSGYNSNYFKEVGSHLWHCLSKEAGIRVTKKNLQLILSQYSLDESISDDTHNNTQLPQFINTTVITDSNFPILSRETEIKYPGSPLAYNSPFYINRPPVERLALAEIHQPGCILRIKAPKRMGKSSLLNQVVGYAKASQYKTVYIDFQEAENTIFTSLDKFLRWFASNVSRQLHLTPKLDDYWDDDIGSKVSCKMYFEEHLLLQIDNPVVLIFNEVNEIFEHPNIVKDFFPMLRFWHEMAQQAEIWQKLRLVLAHSTENYIQFKVNQSPFNVGVTIELPHFTTEQTQELAQRYDLGDNAIHFLAPLQAMLGGHPYLITLALYYLRSRKITLEELLKTAATPTGIYSQHLRELLSLLIAEPQLLSAMQQIVMVPGKIELDAIVAYKLESMGLVQLDGNKAFTSCQLYQLYFCQQLEKKVCVPLVHL